MLTKTRTAKHRIDYGNEDDWIDLAAAGAHFEVEETDLERRRRTQFAYLVRYAPGFRYSEDLPVHELNALTAAVSDIVREENGGSE